MTANRMFCYLWYETTNPDECKFGERWVFAGQDPVREIWKRIKDSLGVRKDLIRDGIIVLEAYWDVTDLAATVGRARMHGRADDYIRGFTGYRKNATGEIHTLPPAEMAVKVNEFIKTTTQVLPEAGLAVWQYEAAEDVITAVNEGVRVILAELCARFGKTIWAGALALETGVPLTIIASYVLTSFSSFAKDLTAFEQFRHMAVVDSASPTYQQTVDQALADKKQVIVFLSMCGSAKRQERIDYLFGRPETRLVFIDEADYGAHTKNQADPLIAAKQADDVVVLMTGTNGERACGNWEIDHYLGATYAELLLERAGVYSSKGQVHDTLKNFEVDHTRSRLVVPVEFYQMNLIRAVEQARKLDPDLFVNGDDTLPSWSKFAADPVKAMGFWTRTLQAVFLGQNNMPEMTIARQVGKAEPLQVAMMFLPGSIRRSKKLDHLADVVEITRQVLSGWRIIPVYGVETSNRRADKHVKQEVEIARKNKQNVLIISAGMAQRSFSVGDITSLYLCYDEGDAGATTQKISRALTPSMVGKVGRIFSLSFDPNRDDKFDSMMLAAAQNYAKRKGMEVDAALRVVIETIDIFACSLNGRVQIDHDTYLMQLLERNSIGRVTGRQAAMGELTVDEITMLAEGNSDYSRAAKTDVAPKGKVGPAKKVAARALMSKDDLKLLDKARKTLVTIVEHLPYLAFMTNCTSIRDSLTRCDEVPDYAAYVTDEFGVPPHKILEFFDRGVLPIGLASLQKAAKTLELQSGQVL